MKHTLVCLALLCLSTISLADDCKNPLLAALGFTALSSPTSGAGLKFCRSLKNAQTCCSSDTIASIQDKISNLGQRLKDSVVTRDKAISEARDQLLPAFSQSVKKLQDAVNKMASNPQLIGADTAILTAITTAFDALGQEANNGAAGLKKSFGGFQKSRTSCVVEILKLQSAAFCLACDPAYASKGVAADGSITFSDKVCKRLQSSCFSFVTAAAAQSQLLAIKTMAEMIDKLTTAIAKVAKGDTSGATDMVGVFSSYSLSETPTAPVQVPDKCTASDCQWICKNLLVKGKLQETTLVIGGSVTDPTGMTPSGTGGKRLLVEAEEGSVVKSKLGKNRILASNEWDPDQDEAGVTVTFQDDPAGVKPSDTSNGRIIGSGFICMIALLVSYLF